MGGCCKTTSVISPLDEDIPSNSSTTSPQKKSTKDNRHGHPLPLMKVPSFDYIEEQRRSSWAPLPSVQSKPSLMNFTNVLLLGETGVGKSTFINAIVNYFTYETLEQARTRDPIMLTPVSFLMTTGDQFDERIVRFGGVDPNEDLDHPGQSVTQHCRSYVFPIGTQTKLRLIDTPGMGDTRGLAQDDLNMQHILSFINNLSHLNAICILLKPNESKLNVVFRSYFTRLLSFLGENVRHNIIFCFTNTRTTFFTPGDTGPLLKKMLEANTIKDIPFKKANTFCFDSESFRYLIARKNGIEFDEYQQKEYQDSWTMSVKESTRLFQYFYSELKPYPHTAWQSIEHAQFQIMQIMRPALETTRNLYRNVILQQEESRKRLIKLRPKILTRPSTICSMCKPTPQYYSDFWVLPDDVHTFTDKCDKCDCSRKVHVDIDYKLEYELSGNADREFIDTMELNLDQLKQAILEFGYFFTNMRRKSELSDPVLSGINRMIEEESEFCSEKNVECLNSILLAMLIQLKEEYMQKRSTMTSNRKSISLSRIYELIKYISEIDPISEQIDSIEEFHQNSMRNQERQIS